jgi:hypothetical protein
MINIRNRKEIQVNDIDFILPKHPQIIIDPKDIISKSNSAVIPIKTISPEIPQIQDPVNNYVTAAIVEENQSQQLISVDGNKSFTLTEVQEMTDWPEYEKAMISEMESIEKNDSWEDVHVLPEGREAVGYETPKRYKARLCAQGFSQTHGCDYFETYSPVIRQASIRIILSIAASEAMHIHQMDVNTAFLNGEIDTEVYMRRPNELGGNAPYVRLKKALYGLKQASRIWNNNIDKFMKELGFKQSKAEPCIYVYGEDTEKVIVGVYVDDLIIASQSLQNIQFVKNALMIRYSMKDLGELNTIIGINVTKNNEGISLNQEKYIDAIIDRFNMRNAYDAYVPMHSSIKFTSDMESIHNNTNLSIEDIPYRQAVGALLYATQCTRPDISFPVSKMSQFMNCYSVAHWQGVEQIIRYLKTTKKRCITYKRHRNSKLRNILVGYSDADWASDVETRKSHGGYVFYLNGAPISWASNKQATVALSSVESEYIALCLAVQELVYLRQLLEDLGYPQTEPTTIFEDNQGTIQLANNDGMYSKRTKHIDVRYHYIREVIKKGWLILKYISTKHQLADILTKALAASKFRDDSAQLLSPMSS